MRTGLNLYPPSEPAVVERLAPVPSLISVTLAPLTTAPEVSVTAPVIEPVSTCACAMVVKSTAAANIASTAFRVQDEMPTRFMTFLLSLRLECLRLKKHCKSDQRQSGRRPTRAKRRVSLCGSV